MKCPACGKDLHQMVEGGVAVEVCAGGCGGMWFDNRELRKFDESHESQGEALLDCNKDQSIQVDRGGKRYCPRCNKPTMTKHIWSQEYDVELDECTTCGGIWLDCGELAWIRNQWDEDQECERAAARYFEDIFGTQLYTMSNESTEKLAKATRYANMFRYLCPTYCIPTKQEWAPFWS